MKQTPQIPAALILLLMFVLNSRCQNPETGSGDQEAGFTPILTESTVEDWEGDPEYWRFEHGVLTGEITPDKILAENTFYIWNGGTVENFELKAEYRISAGGNSGINYRSKKVEGKSYVLRGYQADIDGANRYSGQVYEENGRSILAGRGQVTQVEENNKVEEIATVGEADVLSSVIVEGEWNEYHLIARGNTLVHMINGRLMSIVIDDGSSRQMKGVLGLQLHRGPPMKIEFRNVRLKQIAIDPS